MTLPLFTGEVPEYALTGAAALWLALIAIGTVVLVSVVLWKVQKGRWWLASGIVLLAVILSLVILGVDQAEFYDMLARSDVG